MRNVILFLLASAFLIVSCEDKNSFDVYAPGNGGSSSGSNVGNNGGSSGGSSSGVEKSYSNPVYKTTSCADPSVLRVGDNFYCYSTDHNCNILRSKDLVNWTKVSTAFTNQTRPKWLKKADGSDPFLWAPCCIERDGKYYLYYSVSAGIGLDSSGFGVAVASSPAGPFTDKGPVVQKNDGCGTGGNIDAFYWKEDGVEYIIWGSHQGIFISELSDDALSLKYPGSPAGITKIVGNGWEGPYIYKKNGYYYIFLSTGKAVGGEDATYNVQVGRATSLKGPYTNKNGVNLLTAGGTYKMVESNAYAVGPGHNAEIMTDDEGTEWFIYHSYVRGHADEYKRVLFIDKLTWDDKGWPVMNDGKGPSSTSRAPVFF